MEKWEFFEKFGQYTIWRMRLKDAALGDYIYNATKDGKEPSSKSGYYDLEYLYKIKGVNKCRN